MKKNTLQLKNIGKNKAKDKKQHESPYLTFMKNQVRDVKVLNPSIMTNIKGEKESKLKIPIINLQCSPNKSDNNCNSSDISQITEKYIKEISMSPNQQKTLIKTNLNSEKEVESPILKQKNNISEKNEAGFLANKFTSQKKIQTENSFSHHKCQNHPSKKAKYFKLSEDTVSSEENIERQYFCSKCAINLALKGVKVFDLSNPNFSENEMIINGSKRREIGSSSVMKFLLSSPEIEKNEINEEETIKNKKIAIETFIAELETVQNSGVNSLSFINQKKKELPHIYEKEFCKLEEKFNAIVEHLQLCKKKVYERIKTSNEETISIIHNYQNEISNSLKDMNYMHSDISQNIDNIIRKMEQKPFEIILKKYQEKLKNYENIYQNLKNETVFLNNIQTGINIIGNKPFKLEEEMWKIINSYFKIHLLDNSKLDLQKNDIYVSFDDKELFEKSPLNEKKSANKLTNAAFSERDASPSTQKYLQLLQKVNNNQENNSIFFNNMMKKLPLKYSESCKNIKPPNEINNENDLQKLLFNIDKKKSDINEAKMVSNYQKTLFNSPNFKTNEKL